MLAQKNRVNHSRSTIKKNTIISKIGLKVILMLLCLCIHSNSYAQNQTTTPLTATKETPIIKIGLPLYQTDNYSATKNFNNLIHLNKEFWSFWGLENQYIVKFIHLPINKNTTALQNKTIDIAALNFFDQAASNIIFSIPFAKYQQPLFQRINSNKKLTRVGIHDKSKKSLSNVNHSIKRFYYDDIETLLADNNKLDVLYSITPWLLEEKIQTLKLSNNFYFKQESGINVHLRAATRIADKAILSAINTSFRNIDKIKAKQWQEKLNKKGENKVNISLMIGGYLTNLNEQEKKFILNHNEISFPIVKNGYPPFIIFPAFFDINERGLIIDLFDIITEKTGLTFEPYYSSNVLNTLNAVKKNPLTLYPLMEYTQKRAKVFDFSTPIFNNQYRLFYRQNQQPAPNMTDLNSEVIAVVKYFNTTKRIRSLFPAATFKYYNDINDALTAVSYGDANVFITNSLVGDYFIKKIGLFNVASQPLFEFSRNNKLHFSSLKDNKDLISILNLALSTISPEELNIIFNHWQHKAKANEHNNDTINNLYPYWPYFVVILALLSLSLHWVCRRQLKIRDEVKHQLVEALRLAEAARVEAEQSSQAKISFLARMSHEIRTPMNGILGMAEAINFTNLDTNQHDLLNTLKDSATDLLALLNDVLDFSKMDAGELNLESIPVDISALSQRIVKSFQHHEKTGLLKIALHIDDKINNSYFSDPTRLIQVLNNLFSNAVKFTHKGVIELSVMLIESTESDTEIIDTLRFSVRDTGIGIPSNKHADLFTPFIQADSDTTRKFGGTGLGLSICQEIVASMKGEIAVSSSPNLGSLFYFSLKLKQSSPIEKPKERRKKHRFIANEDDDRFLELRVLIVEDNLVNIKVLSAQLARLHINADVAKNGQEALEMHTKSPYDIVFSDCHMPVMDGFELAKQINQSQTTRPIWLIAVTADALSGTAEKCLCVGFDDFMSKPSSQECVANKLNNGYRQILHKQNLTNKLPSEAKQYEMFDPSILLSLNNQDKEATQKAFSLFTDKWQAEKIKILSALDQNNDDLLTYMQQLRGSLNYLCVDNIDDLDVYIFRIKQHRQVEDSLEIAITVQLLIQRLDILANEINHWLNNTPQVTAVNDDTTL
jgi:two-component system sensor histidine kinase EvgS